jgi:hypothetical protein
MFTVFLQRVRRPAEAFRRVVIRRSTNVLQTDMKKEWREYSSGVPVNKPVLPARHCSSLYQLFQLIYGSNRRIDEFFNKLVEDFILNFNGFL